MADLKEMLTDLAHVPFPIDEYSQDEVAGAEMLIGVGQVLHLIARDPREGEDRSISLLRVICAAAGICRHKSGARWNLVAKAVATFAEFALSDAKERQTWH